MSAKVSQAFRIDREIVDRLEKVSGRRRASKTFLVESALQMYLPTVEGGSRAGASRGATSRDDLPVQAPLRQPAEMVDLRGWLSRRTGIPVAICGHKIEAGSVTVNGEVFRGAMVERPRLGLVALDGEPV